MRKNFIIYKNNINNSCSDANSDYDNKKNSDSDNDKDNNV